MIHGQSEHLNKIKKAMKLHEIAISDKEDLRACKNDLMNKFAMEGGEAEEIAKSIREMFLPKLLEAEGIEVGGCGCEDGKMTDNDEDFADDMDNDHDTENYQDFNSDTDAHNDDSGVDGNEIATIHITVPSEKIRLVEQALEEALGDTDAQSQDHANVHKDKTDIGEEEMDNKNTIEAKKALRRTILAAMGSDDIQSVSRTNGFDHNKSEQLREEDKYPTTKGGMTDPDFSTLDYAPQNVPTIIDDLGLTESNTAVKMDGAPEDREEYSLDFNPFEIPSQGNEELYQDAPIPTEGELPRKRTVNSSVLGDFDANTAEIVLAEALKTAGVEDNDLEKLTYAEALELYKAIRVASKDRDSYYPSGKFDDSTNDKRTDPDTKKAVTETELRDSSGTEEDPEKSHIRKELYSSSKDAKSDFEYANALRKIMAGEFSKKESGTVMAPESQIMVSKSKKESEDHEAEMLKEAELYKARLKTAYAMSHKLALAELLPAEEVDAFAEGMLSDNLTVTAMIRQTKLMLNSAANNAERFAANDAARSIKTASTGISFNPSVRSTVDLSGAVDIQHALKGHWTTSQAGMDEK